MQMNGKLIYDAYKLEGGRRNITEGDSGQRLERFAYYCYCSWSITVTRKLHKSDHLPYLTWNHKKCFQQLIDYTKLSLLTLTELQPTTNSIISVQMLHEMPRDSHQCRDNCLKCLAVNFTKMLTWRALVEHFLLCLPLEQHSSLYAMYIMWNSMQCYTVNSLAFTV